MERNLSRVASAMLVLLVSSSASASTSSSITRPLDHLYQQASGALAAVGGLALMASILVTIFGGGFAQWMGKASNTLMLLGVSGLVTGLVGMAVTGGALM